MTTRLNSYAYIRLIAENLAWVDQQPYSPEKEHIRRILVWSVDQLYPERGTLRLDDHPWLSGPGPTRCANCLIRRDWAGPYYEYFHPSQDYKLFDTAYGDTRWAPSCELEGPLK